MEDKRKIDLQKHVAKRVSKKYLFKIIFYVVLLSALAIFYFKYGTDKTEKKAVKEVDEITNIKIEE